MRVVISRENLLLSLQQVAAVCSRNKKEVDLTTLTISVRYESKELCLAIETGEGMQAVSIVPVAYFLNGSEIASHDEFSQKGDSVITIGEASHFIEWAKKRPKSFEDFTLTMQFDFDNGTPQLSVECCNYYMSISVPMQLIAENDASASHIILDCVVSDGAFSAISVASENSVDGSEFLNILNRCVSGLKSKPSDDALQFVSFFGNSISALKGSVGFLDTGNISFAQEFVLNLVEAKILLHMAKHSETEFKRDSDSNEFKMKLDTVDGFWYFSFLGVTVLYTGRIEQRTYSVLRIPERVLEG